MPSIPPTVIIRHYKERLSKCSVQPLVGRDGYIFATFRKNAQLDISVLPDLSDYVRLDPDAEPLNPKTDSTRGILLIDSTWRYAEKIKPLVQAAAPRSLPGGWTTAYPRRQCDAPDPARGLSSIEALYAAFIILGRDPGGLLDAYHWRETFLEKNRTLIDRLRTDSPSK